MEMYGLMYSFYFNSAVDRVLRKKVHTLGGAQLTVTEMQTAPDDREMSPEGSSCDESELQSCTIEVGGVNKNTSEETVKMFFENRRKSGGGKMDNIWFNKETGNYIITFLTREGELIDLCESIACAISPRDCSHDKILK